MKLIVGLGNPGKEYEKTRHNVGFMTIDKFSEMYNLASKTKDNAEYFEYIDKEKIILIKPLSYMNKSGEVIKKYLDYYKIDLDDLFIIQDDLDLVTGKIRLREKGSAGGHNGIKNIIQNIGTDEFKRIKVGIKDNFIEGREFNAADYVLNKLSGEQLKDINNSIENVINIINDLSNFSFKELQNKYNGGEEV